MPAAAAGRVVKYIFLQHRRKAHRRVWLFHDGAHRNLFH